MIGPRQPETPGDRVYMWIVTPGSEYPATLFGNLNLSSKFKTPEVSTTVGKTSQDAKGRCTRKPNSRTRRDCSLGCTENLKSLLMDQS